MSKIVVVGSSNMDLTVHADHIPLNGETIISGDIVSAFGGKGANQAVAAKRLGGEVTFITKIGTDSYGVKMYDNFVNEGLPADKIIRDGSISSGVAWICVNGDGENAIIVIPGANRAMTVADVENFKNEIISADFVLMQLEIPIEVVEYVAALAAENGVRVILNPAPAKALSRKLLSTLYMITPNENECRLLCGAEAGDSVSHNAEVLLNQGVQNVIVTLGKHGSMLKNAGGEYSVLSHSVRAVDTTGAGDTYNGALCVALSQGRTIEEAMQFATKAAAISVTRHGAQPSIPYVKECEQVR